MALLNNLDALALEAKKDACVWRPSGTRFESLTAVVLGSPRDLRSPLVARAVDTNLFMVVPCERRIQQQTMTLRKVIRQTSWRNQQQPNSHRSISELVLSCNTIVRTTRTARDRRRASRGERGFGLSVGPSRFCGKCTGTIIPLETTTNP